MNIEILKKAIEFFGEEIQINKKALELENMTIEDLIKFNLTLTPQCKEKYKF